MKFRDDLTYEEVNNLLLYFPETGLFKWRIGRGPVHQGQQAGSVWANRVYIKIRNKSYLAHRLAWLLHHGSWPNEQIDHINGIPTDNKINNLREIGYSGNQQNSLTPMRLGKLRGTSYHIKQHKWQAHITVNKKMKYLGLYQTMEDAYSAYIKAKRIYHPQWVEQKALEG